MTAPASRSDLMAALAPATRSNIAFAHERLRKAGFECYLVGGAVRDLLLKRPAGDIDLTTNAPPDQVAKLFRRTIPTGLQHGTITVLLPERKPEPGDAAIRSESFEITTYRAESEYTDARRPDDIRFAETLQEDLSRRDFTVNAIAYEPGSGELIDLFGGLADLESGLLRTIGKAEERFFEDGLRTIRACRFAATLEFDLEVKTEMALRNQEIQMRTAKVAVERFADELWKGFGAKKVSRMIRRLEDSGLLYLFFKDRPGATPDEVCERLDALDAAYPVVRMAEWWAGLNYTGDRARDLARNIKFSNKSIRDLEWTQNYFEFCAAPFKSTFPNTSQTAGKARGDLQLAARIWLSRLKDVYGATEAAEFLDRLRGYPGAPVPVDRLQEILATQPLIVRDLAVGGADLMRLGMSGPAIGENLRYLMDQVLVDPEKNTAAALLEVLDRRRS
ncbi:MAG: hypothetical protein NXI24_20205 [bacterium]|nr:hypothetical protein [bacterium]